LVLTAFGSAKKTVETIEAQDAPQEEAEILETDVIEESTEGFLGEDDSVEIGSMI
jgi:hypothetical protein